METIIQTILSQVPAHVQLAVGFMDARTFYEFVAVAFAAPLVAAAALRHWRRRRTWLMAVVIAEFVCAAAMVVTASAFNVVDFDQPLPVGILAAAVYQFVVVALSRLPDGIGWTIAAVRRLRGQAPSPVAP